LDVDKRAHDRKKLGKLGEPSNATPNLEWSACV
jgi:hypothetical protein